MAKESCGFLGASLSLLLVISPSSPSSGSPVPFRILRWYLFTNILSQGLFFLSMLSLYALRLFSFFWPYQKAYGIFSSPSRDQNLCPLAVKVWSPNRWTARKAPLYMFSDLICHIKTYLSRVLFHYSLFFLANKRYPQTISEELYIYC